jgi:hypothetical protein
MIDDPRTRSESHAWRVRLQKSINRRLRLPAGGKENSLIAYERYHAVRPRYHGFEETKASPGLFAATGEAAGQVREKDAISAPEKRGETPCSDL